MVNVFVGVLTVKIWMKESASLKDRRRVIRSYLDRAKSRFNVSIAEIDTGERYQHATLAISCVGGEQGVLRNVLETVLRKMESSTRAEIVHSFIEIR